MKIDNDAYYGVKGVRHIFQNEKQVGLAKVTPFDFLHKDDPLFNLRQLREDPMFVVRDGEYVKLHVNGELMMSDTGMERISNKPFIKNANGDVLIAGLGIGLIVYNILENKNITSITIIEKYQNVIDLVSPNFNDPRITYINADIFEWKPAKGVKYDTIYFDIWPQICTDNLKDISLLHNRFKSFKKSGGWMNSWLKDYLQKQKRKGY